jgi:hypothetical protein
MSNSISVMDTQYTPLCIQVHIYIQNKAYIPNCISFVAKLLG